ncbi:MAG: hypothetical protein ACE366_03805 [Bradymonadia bacterium]
MRCHIIITLLTAFTSSAFAGPGDGVVSQSGVEWLMKPVPKQTSEAHHMQLVEALLQQKQRRQARQKQSTQIAEQVWVKTETSQPKTQSERPSNVPERRESIDSLLRRLWVGPEA